MKEDVGEIPPRPPAKRRQLEQALDLWLAVWLTDEGLTPSERRRVLEEKARRREPGVERIVGFTGTRAGMTRAQKAKVRELLLGATGAHHGDCVGADEQFHNICVQLAIPVTTHPPEETALRARCRGAVHAEPPKPYLERNKDIVRACSVMLAAPKETREPPPGRGQGTWSTVRFSRSRGVQTIIILPSGDLLTLKEDGRVGR